MAEGETRISRADVEHAARLARLALTDEEIETLTVDLAKILDHAALVSALDTTGVPPTSHPVALVNVLRPDVPRPGLDQAEVLEGRRRRGLPVAEDGPVPGAARILSECKPGEPAAVDIAAAVRSGERRAIDVLEEHLARIAAREDEIHAFNLVLEADAAPRPTPSTRRSTRAAIRGRSPAFPSR